MSRAKTLVTGATGMTGSHTVQLLLKRGHTVRAIAHSEDERSMRLQELGAEVVIGDMLNLNDVRLALSGIRGAYFVYPPGLIVGTPAGFAFGDCASAERSLPTWAAAMVMAAVRRKLLRSWLASSDLLIVFIGRTRRSI